MNVKEWFDLRLVKLIAAPLGRRIGTVLATYLVAKGIPADGVEQLLTALGVVGGILLDLSSAYVQRKRA